MTLALILVEVGALLIYAGVKGKSVSELAVGNDQTQAQNQSVTQ